MATATQVLDHGYVKLIEAYGSDEQIIEAARMSTGKGFQGWGPTGVKCPRTGCGWSGQEADLIKEEGDPRTHCPRCGDCGLTTVPGDEKLLRYLWKNKHSTPFEMAGAIVEVQAPIFVFREWHRHRTQSYNEMSARYMPLPDVNYVPTVERLMLGGGHLTKQSGTVAGAAALTESTAQVFRESLAASYGAAQELYDSALADGIPKELARVHLPVGRYSRMRAHANLRNWCAFLTLRQAPNAQWEIRQYANALHDILAVAFPRTLALFDEAPHG